jgi:hypothetical protein
VSAAGGRADNQSEDDTKSITETDLHDRCKSLSSSHHRLLLGRVHSHEYPASPAVEVTTNEALEPTPSRAVSRDAGERSVYPALSSAGVEIP